MNRVWSQSELAYIKANCAILTDRKIGQHLTTITGRPITTGMVRRQRQRMGIRKKKGRGVCEIEEPILSAVWEMTRKKRKI